MILYSIVPQEKVFEKFNDDTNNYVEVQYMGEMIQALPIGNSEYMINRIFSTSLSAYLNPKLQPGSIIRI